MSEFTVVAADLGPSIAAFTCRINGRPTAVVNAAARHDPTLRMQAARALHGVGIDAGCINGALHGIRS